MSNFFEFIIYIYKESFIFRFLKLVSNLYEDSFIKRFFKKIKLLFLNSYIFSILTKEDEEISIKVKFRFIEYKGNIESLFIFLSLFGIYLTLTISDLVIKILISVLIYIILYVTIFDKDILQNSYIYKQFLRSFYE